MGFLAFCVLLLTLGVMYQGARIDRIHYFLKHRSDELGEDYRRRFEKDK